MATALEIHQSLDTLLDNPRIRYEAGLVKTIFEKGGLQYFGDLPMVTFNGVTSDIELELQEPAGTSVRGAYARSVVMTNAKVARIPVPDKALMRNVETPKKSKKFNSRFFRQRETRLQQNAKRLGKDLITQSFLGMGVGDNFWGYEYWLQGFAGLVNPGGTTYPNDSADVTWPKATDQKIFATDDKQINGSAQPLDSDWINMLLIRSGNERWNQIACDLDSYLAVESILDNLPGNTAEYRKEERFGTDVLVYKGVYFIRYDTLSRIKQSTRVDCDAAGDTLTIDAPEPDSADERWMGFSDKDYGATIEIWTSDSTINDDGTITTGTAMATDTIASVTSWKEVELSSGLGADFQSGSDLILRVSPQPAMYGLYFDDYDGIHTLYGAKEEGELMADPTDEYGSILGMALTEVGPHPTDGRYHIDHLDWFGNSVVAAPTAICRMTGYTVPL